MVPQTICVSLSKVSVKVKDDIRSNFVSPLALGGAPGPTRVFHSSLAVDLHAFVVNSRLPLYISLVIPLASPTGNNHTVYYPGPGQ